MAAQDKILKEFLEILACAFAQGKKSGLSGVNARTMAGTVRNRCRTIQAATRKGFGKKDGKGS